MYKRAWMHLRYLYKLPNWPTLTFVFVHSELGTYPNVCGPMFNFGVLCCCSYSNFCISSIHCLLCSKYHKFYIYSYWFSLLWCCIFLSQLFQSFWELWKFWKWETCILSSANGDGMDLLVRETGMLPVTLKIQNKEALNRRGQSGSLKMREMKKEIEWTYTTLMTDGKAEEESGLSSG